MEEPCPTTRREPTSLILSNIEPHKVTHVKCGNEPNDSGLASTTKATGISGIQTSGSFGDMFNPFAHLQLPVGRRKRGLTGTFKQLEGL